jgi:hypothetical protein
MTIEDRIIQLRNAIISVREATVDTYPDVRDSILANGGPGFAEGIELCLTPYYDVVYVEDEFDEVTETYELVTPTAVTVTSGTLLAVLKNMLQITLATQWLQQ